MHRVCLLSYIFSLVHEHWMAMLVCMHVDTFTWHAWGYYTLSIG